MSEQQRKYRPSNGSEGDWFCSTYCYNCIRGKYEHTGDTRDNPCDIISSSMCFDTKDDEYPKEWIYNESNEPTCTSFVKWDWEKGDDEEWNDPPVTPDTPDNQLCFPFAFEELENQTFMGVPEPSSATNI